MAYRDVLAILTSCDEDQVLRAAKLVAGKAAGRVAPVYAFEMPDVVASSAPEMLALWPQLLEQTRARASEEQKEIKKRLKALDIVQELQAIETPRGLAGASVGARAMQADISVMQAPRSDLAIAVFEGVLFKSGRPTLLVPRGWQRETLGDRVLVAWKPTREAARAVSDAAAFVRAANGVTVVTVDATDDSGRSIATLLERDCADVGVRNVDGRGNPAEAAILNAAKAVEADLIVMGGYGHGRLTEFVFGGVTRSLLHDCPIPVLISH
jgi:nucleotide-binding universal stress UspA family protein